MLLRLAHAGLLAVALLATPFSRGSSAQPLDPALFGERLLRLTSTVESLELTLASQKRQIDALNSEVQRLREELASEQAKRPWTDDLKRIADALQEIDRKRISDNEHVLKVLEDVRRAVAAAAEASRPAPRGSDARGSSTKAAELGAKKALPYVMKRGETLSGILEDFNPDAARQGYRRLTVQQLMDFNAITDATRIPEGATIMLPLIPE
jgi:hypothetical protein